MTTNQIYPHADWARDDTIVSMIKDVTPLSLAPRCYTNGCTQPTRRIDRWWFGSECTAHRNVKFNWFPTINYRKHR